MLRKLRTAGLVAVSLFIAIPAVANSVVNFTFSGLSNNEQALNYFSGAYGSQGSGPGPNYQITFSPKAATASGRKGNLLTANGTIVMDVHTGFANSFKLTYVTLAPEVISVWSGYDGSGFLLATMTLLPNAWCESVAGCGWSLAAEPFSGTAASVTFSGAGAGFGIGSVKLGSRYWSKPVITANTRFMAQSLATPEPSSIVLLQTGLAGLIWIYMRRKQANVSVLGSSRRS
jgi:hypothetical protein